MLQKGDTKQIPYRGPSIQNLVTWELCIHVIRCMHSLNTELCEIPTHYQSVCRHSVC